MRHIFMAYATAAFCLVGALVVAQPPEPPAIDKPARNDDTSASLQWLLDKNHEWLANVHSLSATVEAERVSGYPPVASYSTGTVTVSGNKYKLTISINRPGKRGMREAFQETVHYNGSQYLQMDSLKKTAVVGSSPPAFSNHSPYFDFQMPFTNVYSWLHIADSEMKNSMPALKNGSLWKAEQHRDSNVTDEKTSNGLVKKVTFLWDYRKSGLTDRTSMVFSERSGYKPESFQTVVMDDATPQFTLTGSVTKWTTVTLGGDNGSVIVPVENLVTVSYHAGQHDSRKLLRADTKTLRFNEDISDDEFNMPPIPTDYKIVSAETWEKLTTDPETLRNWNDSMRLKSCLECSETTPPEHLPTGDLNVEITVEGMGEQPFAGQGFRVFYRNGNCCVLMSSGTLAAEGKISLKGIPGEREGFEYAVCVDDTHMSTFEPTTSGPVTLIFTPVANQLAPDIQLTDMFTSETTALSNFRGQKLVLDFWAIDCPPCRLSLIQLNGYARSLGPNSKTGFLALTRKGQLAEPTVNFVKDNQLGSLRSFWVSNDAFSYAGMQGIPFTLFVDETGRIVWQGHPDNDFQERLLEFLGR